MASDVAQGSHCSYCGNGFTPEQQATLGPRKCGQCGNTTYFNPLPVAVVLVPVAAGLLLIRRGVAPQIGRLALPGGFINQGETWQQAGAREVGEETGLTLDSDEIRLYDCLSAPDGTLLVFGLARQRSLSDLPPFEPNEEVTERVVADAPTPLAFPLHDQAAQRFWLDNRARLHGWMAS